MSVPTAIERLVGLQAQLAQAPYIGLWTRLHNFKRDDLARLIEDHSVIKATMMRATLHLFTAEDYLLLRAALQPVLAGAARTIAKSRDQELDIDQIVAVARQYIAEAPRTFAEISAMLAEHRPDVDLGAMRYTVRTHLPLVQVPTGTQWSYPGNPKFALAEQWLGKPIPAEDNFRMLVLRYLAAFGPASVTDLQMWSGLSKLKDAIEKLKPELVTYRDEDGRELLDLPDLPLSDADTPMPERFLPEFDNLLLSHNKRTRVLANEYRSKVYLPGLRVAATFLVDGFVHGTWKIEKQKKDAATLVIKAFEPLTTQSRNTLAEEGEKLVRFIESSAKTFEVRFVD